MIKVLLCADDKGIRTWYLRPWVSSCWTWEDHRSPHWFRWAVRPHWCPRCCSWAWGYLGTMEGWNGGGEYGGVDWRWKKKIVEEWNGGGRWKIVEGWNGGGRRKIVEEWNGGGRWKIVEGWNGGGRRKIVEGWNGGGRRKIVEGWNGGGRRKIVDGKVKIKTWKWITEEKNCRRKKNRWMWRKVIR